MMLAYCGLDCETCDAFIATKKNDDTLRKKIAAEWTQQFGHAIPAESINCTGCQGKGVKLHYCSDLCEVRKCAVAKQLPHCGACPDYACARLEEILGKAPEARKRLDERRPKPDGKS